MKVVKRYKKIITVPKKLEFILGKHGTHYKKYCAFSIQPQNYPNAIHYVSLYIYIFFGFLLKFFTKINIQNKLFSVTFSMFYIISWSSLLS